MKWIKYVMLVVLLCSMSVPVEAYEEKSSLTIGIIAPMEGELKLLRSKMDIESTEKLANFEFYKGTLDGVDTVLVRSGIGKVNSAVAAQNSNYIIQSKFPD